MASPEALPRPQEEVEPQVETVPGLKPPCCGLKV